MQDKKVLIIEESEVAKERLILLINNITNLKVDTPKNINNAKELFDKNSYEFIIIEHNCKQSDEFMDYVLRINSKQKMILLSDSLNCPVDCDTCSKKFNFVRLIKPITMDNVVKYLVKKDENFICPNKYKFDNVDTLEKLFEFVYLDENYFFTEKELKDNCLYIKTKLTGTLRFDELIKIEDLVNKKYFQLSVMEDNTIVITKL